jgi:4-amino-4-deoxy-L-arabinose transferase-like glycosyltransferase
VGERAPTGPEPSRRRVALALGDPVLVGVVLAGTVLRFWGFAAQSLWYDEWLTSEAASGSLGHLRSYVTEQAGIPPTYFGFMWMWARAFGDSDAALRLPSVIFGITLIGVVYAAVRELGQGRTAARIAAVLVAVNPMLVWYSQEARPYSLLALLGTLSLLLLARYWRTGTTRDLGLWAFVAALAIAVHYVAVFLVVVEAAALLARRQPDRRDLVVGAVPGIVVLVLLAPFGWQQFSRRENHSWINGFSLRSRANDAAHSALVGPTPPYGKLWLLVLLAVVAAGALVVARGGRDERRAAALAAGFGLVPVALALVAAVVGVDMILARYLIVVLGALIGAVAVGLAVAKVPRPVGLGITAVVVVVSVVTVVADARDPELQRPDWRAVAEAHQATAGGQGQDQGPADEHERVLVVNIHGFLAWPLHRYLDGERRLGPDEPVTVDHIDVLVAKPTDQPCNMLVGLACSLIFLGAPPPAPLADRLHLDERIDLDQFVIDRYTADEPVTVTPADLVDPSTLPDSLVLVTG